MSENRVDLKRLILLIKENKDFQANLILDEGCVLETADAKPLIKVINYLINYLNQLSEQPVEISLDLRSSDYLLNLMVYTAAAELPAPSGEVENILKSYNASMEKIHESGKYIQFKVSFAR
ncbi:MAG: hypothetical protein E4H13_10145 [Calditrichales bacterium]|nr:MAG: hypothetical protein E4H13_10145 [Calditrichales bacterium]